MPSPPGCKNCKSPKSITPPRNQNVTPTRPGSNSGNNARSPPTSSQQQQQQQQPTYNRHDVFSQKYYHTNTPHQQQCTPTPQQQRQYQPRHKSKSPKRPQDEHNKSKSPQMEQQHAQRRNMSRSPINRGVERNHSFDDYRHGRKSRSPVPQRKHNNNNGNANNSSTTYSPNYYSYSSSSPCPQQHHNQQQQQKRGPADMTVLVTRTDLVDSGTYLEQQQQNQSQQQDDATSSVPYASAHHQQHHYPIPEINDYSWQRPGRSQNNDNNTDNTNGTVVVCRVPPCPPPNIDVQQNVEEGKKASTNSNNDNDDENDDDDTMHHRDYTLRHSWMHPAALLVDNNTPQPLSLNPELIKYWNQRRRLFSRFDYGIELDDEGWFSVTPEQIADHVAHRMIELVKYHNHTNHHDSNDTASSFPRNKITVLDAFGGCGGNAISFAKCHDVELVICVDIDRTKLQRAANNANIYNIPSNKIVFIECNVVFILQYCYKNGMFVLDEPISTPEQAMELMSVMPPPCHIESCHGYQVGGIDLLPRHIDTVFLDPPWGGVDYSVFGKSGYDLQKNMWIQRPVANTGSNRNHDQTVSDSGADLNGFFDTFQALPRNKHERKAQFNSGLDESNCLNGAELLALAASATSVGRYVIYDVPRNTNRISIGQAALFAGYHGNIKLEEHCLNGRLKTITAYFGYDWKELLIPKSKDDVVDDNPNSVDNDDKDHVMNALAQSAKQNWNMVDETNQHRMTIDQPSSASSTETSTVYLPFLPRQSK